MADRTTKLLLAVIVVVLTAILFRLDLPGIPALAQAVPIPVASVPVMTTNNNIVYILQNGRLSAYYLDSATTRTLVPDAAKQRLRHLDTLDLSDQKAPELPR
jgi:hypothetical protein